MVSVFFILFNSNSYPSLARISLTQVCSENKPFIGH